MARVFISHSSRDNDQADEIKRWLEEQGFDAPFLDFDKHIGIAPGDDWERKLYREIDQSEALIIVQTPNWLESKWCFAEFTQARALGKPIFPVIHTPTGDTLIAPDVQALDLTKDAEGGLEQLARSLSQIALDAQGGFKWDSTRPPYPGLLAFQEEDAALYFGRDDDIRRLIERLNARRAQGGAKLIALLGSSGSGKSSLMRAGVLPRLRRVQRTWIVLDPMRPRARPVDELARTLTIALGSGSWRRLRDDLLDGDIASTLSDIANDLKIRNEANEAQILLPIDQAEEMFGASDSDQARRFMEILSSAMEPEMPFMGLLCMRSDFLGALQAAESLTARFDEFSLAPMPLTRIPQIIEGPARVAGLGLDDEFVQAAARDAETEDALPLLAFALRELYDRAAGDNHLSLDEYRALGDSALGLTPLENAVRKSADDVLADAAPDAAEEAALRDAFVPQMVRVNDQGEYVRQPARWDELPAKAHPLLDRLAKARLLIIRQEDDARNVEVAHEALLRKWPRLRGWLDEAREFLSGKQQLERDLADWTRAETGVKRDALLTGLKLTRARGWISERPHQLSDAERAFISASIDAEEAEANRKARLRRIITVSSVAAAVILAIATGFSIYQWQQTQQSIQTRAKEQIRFVWVDLGEKEVDARRLTAFAQDYNIEPSEVLPNPIRTQRDGFDCKTWLESGFRSLYCSVRNIVGFKKLEALSGIPIFLEGSPHTDELNFTDTGNFGRYNPEFLAWVDKYLFPEDLDGPHLAETARMVYDNKIGPVVRALYNSHQILFAEPAAYAAFEQDFEETAGIYKMSGANERRFGSEVFTLDEVIADYQDELATGAVAQCCQDDLGERFRWLADYLATARDDDWYLANTAGGFWVRRTIDGTQGQIYQLLVKIIRRFDPETLDLKDR